jgi:hypothetical protein
MIYFGKLFIFLAALWAVGASLYIFFAPLTIQRVESISSGSTPATAGESTFQTSWYNVQGLWGVIVLILFAGFYLWALALAYRGRYTGLIILSLVALLLSFLTGFSIGGFYLPAALTLLAGALVLSLSRATTRYS